VGKEDLGYDVLELSLEELSFLEVEYDRMIETVRTKSQEDLKEKRLMNEGEDDSFTKSLNEAVVLLERDEKQRIALSKVGANESVQANEENAGKMGKHVDMEEEEEKKKTQRTGTDDANDSHTRNSSSVARTKVYDVGTGKRGDLEQFFLPIIYSALHTGFQPTRDLTLESGNIVAQKYLVEEEIGSAAFSTAYKCIDLSVDENDYHRQVCLKVIKNTKDFFDQSLDEIKILELLRQTNQCQQNNILEMLSYFYHREHLIIVTELLCLNLFDFSKYLLENGQENYFQHMGRLKWITKQILTALQFLHNMNLIHSDVKPENILFESYSRAKVKLIDFGSSCFLRDRQSSYIQSRSYRAPEVILGLPYDSKIDVWSLGCVVAEMYTNQVTFLNNSIVSMLSRIEAICGAFPKHMREQGRHGNKYFTRSGLLFRKVKAGENDGDEHMMGSMATFSTDGASSEAFEYIEIYRPKMTTLSERLGFPIDLMERPRKTVQDEEHAMFTDFVQSLLTIDPEARPTTAEALRHPWILSGSNLTIDDIKYVPSCDDEYDDDDDLDDEINSSEEDDSNDLDEETNDSA